jgi:hypothetical protein
MELFDFDFHSPTTEYPQSGDSVQLGRSYTFTSAPVAPDQRTITLNFAGMINYWDLVNNAPDVTTNPKRNFYRLEQFYLFHRMAKRFNYEHPQYGMLVCTFKEPLKTPKKVDGQSGWLEAFSVVLLEHP